MFLCGFNGGIHAEYDGPLPDGGPIITGGDEGDPDGGDGGHPWGGEESVSSDIVSKDRPSTTLIVTGMPMIDLFFSRYFSMDRNIEKVESTYRTATLTRSQYADRRSVSPRSFNKATRRER
jgi:hypothetical protein